MKLLVAKIETDSLDFHAKAPLTDNLLWLDRLAAGLIGQSLGQGFYANSEFGDKSAPLLLSLENSFFDRVLVLNAKEFTARLNKIWPSIENAEADSDKVLQIFLYGLSSKDFGKALDSKRIPNVQELTTIQLEELLLDNGFPLAGLAKSRKSLSNEKESV